MATEILFDGQWSKSYKNLTNVQRAMAKLEQRFNFHIRYYVQTDWKTKRLIPVIIVPVDQITALIGSGYALVR